MFFTFTLSVRFIYQDSQRLINQQIVKPASCCYFREKQQQIVHPASSHGNHTMTQTSSAQPLLQVFIYPFKVSTSIRRRFEFQIATFLMQWMQHGYILFDYSPPGTNQWFSLFHQNTGGRFNQRTRQQPRQRSSCRADVTFYPSVISETTQAASEPLTSLVTAL